MSRCWCPLQTLQTLVKGLLKTQAFGKTQWHIVTLKILYGWHFKPSTYKFSFHHAIFFSSSNTIPFKASDVMLTWLLGTWNEFVREKSPFFIWTPATFHYSTFELWQLLPSVRISFFASLPFIRTVKWLVESQQAITLQIRYGGFGTRSDLNLQGWQ